MQKNQELHASVENVETLCVIFVHTKTQHQTMKYTGCIKTQVAVPFLMKRARYMPLHCEEALKNILTLNNHMIEMHPEGFDSVIGLSQISLHIEESKEESVKETNMSRLIKCQQCEKWFLSYCRCQST